MAGEPKRSEGGSGGSRTQEDGSRERRFQKPSHARAPRHHEVNVEGDADAEYQRQRDNVGEVHRQSDQHAGTERDNARKHEWRERTGNVSPAPERQRKKQRDGKERKNAGLDESPHDRPWLPAR